jgi:hypothetical protein
MNALICEILLMLFRAFIAKQAEKAIWEKRIQLAFQEQDASGDHIAVIRSEDQRLKQVLRERKNAGGKDTI